MSNSRRLFIGLAITVIVWFLGLTYLPQIVGTCLDGECGFSIGEIIVSLAIPLAFFAMPIVLEMVLYKKGLSRAASDIGVTRFNWTGIRLAAVFVLPLIVFYPLFSLITHTPLATRPNWQWFVLSGVLINGFAEETMMRGFVFRHLREGRPFWRAAALSTVYFAAYHLHIILAAGALIGIIGVLLAIPTGFVTAYIYERGNNTIWGPALLHVLFTNLAIVFIYPTDIQPIAGLLYLVVGILLSITMLVWMYRSRYGRMEAQSSVSGV